MDRRKKYLVEIIYNSIELFYFFNFLYPAIKKFRKKVALEVLYKIIWFVNSVSHLWSGGEVRGCVIIWRDSMLSKLRHKLPSQSVTTPLVAEVAKSSQRSQLTQQSVHFDHSVLFIGRVLGQNARNFARIVRVVFLGELRRRPSVVVGHRSQHSLKNGI